MRCQNICLEDRRMDDLQFYILFNSISVISGPWVEIMKGCMKWNPVFS